MNLPEPLGSTDGSNPDDDSLVAYLDGELDAAATEQIEARLAAEPEFRARLQALQQTWDLLDSLPAVRTPDAFTQSTIEFAVQAVQREARARQPWLRRQGPLLLGVALGVACGIGAYRGVRYWREAPVRQLVRDLRVIENMELYRTADRNLDYVEFLKQLDQAQLFAPREGSHD